MNNRGLLVVILCIAAVLLFCGCLGNNEQKTNTTTNTNSTLKETQSTQINQSTQSNAPPLTENTPTGQQPAFRYVKMHNLTS